MIKKARFYAVRTVGGQEYNVASVLASRVKARDLPIKAILVPERLKGYILVEADSPHTVDTAIAGIKHARSRVPGIIEPSEIDRYLVVKPIIEELGIDDIVEVIGGPLRGNKARVTRIDKAKGEIIIELLDVALTLPITVSADYVRILKKAGEEGGGEESY
jgi:transcriptional antiterminator NusG